MEEIYPHKTHEILMTSPLFRCTYVYKYIHTSSYDIPSYLCHNSLSFKRVYIIYFVHFDIKKELRGIGLKKINKFFSLGIAS